MSCHPAKLYHTVDELIADYTDEAFARMLWKKHIEKNGNVPYIIKCAVCSGFERKRDYKAGRWNPRRPTKSERDEIFSDE
jgi:hypothetical protein